MSQPMCNIMCLMCVLPALAVHRLCSSAWYWGWQKKLCSSLSDCQWVPQTTWTPAWSVPAEEDAYSSPDAQEGTQSDRWAEEGLTLADIGIKSAKVLDQFNMSYCSPDLDTCIPWWGRSRSCIELSGQGFLGFLLGSRGCPQNHPCNPNRNLQNENKWIKT